MLLEPHSATCGEAPIPTAEVIPSRDKPFNPWHVPHSSAAATVVQEACQILLDYEKGHALRKRARREVDQITFECTVQAVICDLIHHHLSDANGGVFITRSNTVLRTPDRYRAVALNKTLPDILDRLAAPEVGLIHQSLGCTVPDGKAKRTVIRPAHRLTEMISAKNLTTDDLRLGTHRELIQLNNKEGNRGARSRNGICVAYDDTCLTNRYRSEMRLINKWIGEADLSYDKPVVRSADGIHSIHDRALRRVFTQGSFRCGGRLFGGFWQPLNKAQRLEHLRVDGERIAELDFGQMCPRIAYGLVGVTPSMEDAYDIPGFELDRDGIKTIFNAMMFVSSPMCRFPRDVRPKFSGNPKIAEVTRSIEAAHPALADVFYTMAGHRLQFRESQIMVDVLFRLMDLGIAALPIHDAVLVAASKAEEARSTMLEVFRDQTGVEGRVTVET